MPKKKNLDLGSARAPDFGEPIFFFFLNGMVLAYARKIKNKRFPARARTRLENRTDPNPLITGRSPKGMYSHVTPSGCRRWGGDACLEIGCSLSSRERGPWAFVTCLSRGASVGVQQAAEAPSEVLRTLP